MRRLALLSCLLVPSIVGTAQPATAELADNFGLISHNATYHTPASNLETVSIGRSACCDQSGWFGDLGFYILNPRFTNGNAAFSVTDLSGGAVTGSATTTHVNFDHDAEFVPLFQIGYAGRNGLGVRGRFWTLDSTAGVAADNLGPGFAGPSLLGAGANFNADLVGPGAGVPFSLPGVFNNAEIVAEHQLRMDVIDLEGIWSIDYVRTSLLLSAGIRYAHVGQRYDATVTQNYDSLVILPFPSTIVGTQTQDTISSFHSFNGAGPTVSAQMYRGIGDTNLSIYGLSRGSLLVGEHRHNVTSINQGERDLFARNVYDGVLPVIELEVGGSWVLPTRRFDLFVEGGFVAMTWFNAGNAANSDPIVSGIGSDNANQNMHLTGLRFSSGVRF